MYVCVHLIYRNWFFKRKSRLDDGKLLQFQNFEFYAAKW